MAKEHIERDAVVKELQEELDFESPMYTADQNKHINIGLKIALRVIRKALAADVVEVVRCKDCKHGSIDDHTGKGLCRNPMGCYGCVPTKEDGFCSFGEKRDNE